MQVYYSGIDFQHENGEFCKRKIVDSYGFFLFSTPFLYEKDGEMLRGEAGDLVIISPGEVVYHGPISHDESFVNDWMFVSKDFASILENFPIPCGQNIKIGRQDIVRFAIKNINKEQMLKQRGSREKIQCILTELVIDLYRIYRTNETETCEMRISTARNAIMRNPEADWSLQKMADLSGYSVSRFSALYTQQYGLSPKADLLQRRLDMAEQMLIYSQYSVGEIAERCGFQSIYYFSKYFKKKTGMAPRDFIKHSITDEIND